MDFVCLEMQGFLSYHRFFCALWTITRFLLYLCTNNFSMYRVIDGRWYLRAFWKTRGYTLFGNFTSRTNLSLSPNNVRFFSRKKSILRALLTTKIVLVTLTYHLTDNAILPQLKINSFEKTVFIKVFDDIYLSKYKLTLAFVLFYGCTAKLDESVLLCTTYNSKWRFFELCWYCIEGAIC